MAKGAAGNGEFEHHIVAVRARIHGTGLMRYTLESYDAVQVLNLTPLTLQQTTRFEPTVLANFQSQRTRLVGTVTDIDENFDVHKIIVWAKPVAIEYPQ